MNIITCSPDPFSGPYAGFLETYQGPPVTVYTEAMDIETWNEKADIRPLGEVDNLPRFLTWAESIPALSGGWEYDVPRFCKKAFVWFHHARRCTGPMFWFDSDVVFDEPVQPAKLLDLLGDADMCYMGRRNFHPCTSFVGWNLDKKGGDFLSALEKLYLSTMFLRAPKWTDAHLTGYVIEQAPKSFNARNLTPEGEPVANVFDEVFQGVARHMKGPRKFAA